jgi:hypothetical protein
VKLRLPAFDAVFALRALPALPAGRARLLTGLAGAVLVVALVSWQLLHRGLGVGISAQIPASVASPLPTMTVVPQTLLATERNPFDPTLMPWKADLPALSTEGKPAPPPSTASGVLQLPGFAVAVTEKGLIRPGEAMLGGHFKGVEGDFYMIENDAGEVQRIAINRPPRPTLQSLSRAKKDAQDTP